MNKVLLIGRVSSDVRVFQTQSGVRYARVRLAINRRGTTDITDFIPLVAWRSNADFMASNVYKGTLIAVEGSIYMSSYQKDGINVSSFEVNIDNINILEPKSVVQSRMNSTNSNSNGRFVTEIPSRDFGERMQNVPNQQVRRFDNNSNQSLYNNTSNHSFAGFTVDETFSDSSAQSGMNNQKITFTPTEKLNELNLSNNQSSNNKDFLSNLDEDDDEYNFDSSLFTNDESTTKNNGSLFELDSDSEFEDDIFNPNHNLDFDK
ncbi:single-stranded DNA-binding protein [Mycoplasmopsis anatis]|uniref:Single-stranded DNA-binding protein n=1 Tax=Mycoplasmopsis anatis TaxID=171279 RepID=A0A9Q3L703_9BACT|nr:single-stranded DNA-binding protein [Mycoplasmopsis anatis]MBW0594446.1 single-stranded DNA-binding protein [Mycoplasmopsis anatis]MBW0595477.1 single-stranded DNA-binding protein [Mycoplasmopsis anatis]MBW0595951.1 single-stranded DNA-binding protein [Mycoplasmopsis anatis]MBW0596670.1 single-stranded DNA-binding protein [Mycoplasmopsis anatis]MBW0597397.1 single-stranded DNA-binding protein [Mycoplasmopsis anatis]